MGLTPKPKRLQVTVYVNEDDVRRIDAIKAARGVVSRNEVVRYIFEKGLPIVEAEVHGRAPKEP